MSEALDVGPVGVAALCHVCHGLLPPMMVRVTAFPGLADWSESIGVLEWMVCGYPCAQRLSVLVAKWDNAEELAWRERSHLPFQRGYEVRPE